MRVHVTGSPCIVTERGVVRTPQIGAPQATALFVLLAVDHRRTVSLDEIVEHLWPEAPPSRPEVGIRSLASKLRRRLPAGLSIEASVGCYQMPLGAGAWLDLEAATASAEMAEHLVRAGRPRGAAGPALVATSIARHGVLYGWPSAWADQVRRRLAQTHLRGLACMVDFSRAVGDLGQTVRLLEETVRLAPYKESAYRDLMRAHTDAGERAAAIKVYDDLRALLAAELDAEPAMTTTALLREVLAHQ